MPQHNNLEMILNFLIGLPTYVPLWPKKDCHILKVLDDTPTKKKKKKNYEPNCKCQDNWESWFPWTKMSQGGDGEIENFHCLICALQCMEGNFVGNQNK